MTEYTDSLLDIEDEGSDEDVGVVECGYNECKSLYINIKIVCN